MDIAHTSQVDGPGSILRKKKNFSFFRLSQPYKPYLTTSRKPYLTTSMRVFSEINKYQRKKNL